MLHLSALSLQEEQLLSRREGISPILATSIQGDPSEHIVSLKGIQQTQ